MVDLAAARLKLNIEYDAAALKGTATLRLGAGVTDTELWDLTNQLLASRGFTTVRPPGLATLSVVKLADAAGAARLESAEVSEWPAVRAGFMAVMRPMKSRPAKDMLEPLKSVLGKGSGVAADVGGRVLMVADLTPRLESALGVVERLDAPSDAVVVEEVRLSNLSAGQLTALVTLVTAKREAVAGRKMVGEVVTGAAGAGGNSVLVIAPPGQVEAWRSLITSLDQREPVQRVSYTPRGFAAKDVARLIEQTIKQGGDAGVGGVGGAGDERFRVAVDDLTDTLVVTATPAQHDQVRALVERLDAVPPAERRPVRSFVVKNRPVLELTAVLQRMLAAGVLEAEADSGAGALGAGSGRNPFGTELPAAPGPALANPPAGSSALILPGGGLMGQGGASVNPPGADDRTRTRGGWSRGAAAVSLTADEGTNSIIAIGDARALSQLEALIRVLDVRQSQVMLDVFMISLTDSQTLSLGVELEKLRITGNTSIKLASLFGLSTPIVTPGGASRSVPESEGFNGVVLDPGDFSVVVKALETLGNGRSLSSPRLLVSNNQNAVFNSVLQQPFAASFTSGGSTVPTTSFGGTQDAGTQVSVKPQIAEGDQLLLDYTVSISSFAGKAASANVPPPKQLNSVKSTAVIPDGYAVVVGGLELKTDNDGASQIPILGSIPILGHLFKNQSRDDSRTRFFVFIRANVLRGGSFEALRYFSERDGKAAGLPSDWPVNEPRIVR